MKLEFESLFAELKSKSQQILEQRSIKNPLLVGIQTGGVTVAQRLHKELGVKEALSSLNINFYRDDFSRIGLHPHVGSSDLAISPDERHVILVDDVLYTGRTIRAALNEIFDYGRPASVILAVLIERNGRELPIHADVRGGRVDLGDKFNIKLQGSETIKIV